MWSIDGFSSLVIPGVFLYWVSSAHIPDTCVVLVLSSKDLSGFVHVAFFKFFFFALLCHSLYNHHNFIFVCVLCIFVFQTVITCHPPHFKMSITILHGYSWFDPSNLKTAGSHVGGRIIFWVSVAARAEHSSGTSVKLRATPAPQIFRLLTFHSCALYFHV